VRGDSSAGIYDCSDGTVYHLAEYGPGTSPAQVYPDGDTDDDSAVDATTSMVGDDVDGPAG
jgi:hypothetical protein